MGPLFAAAWVSALDDPTPRCCRSLAVVRAGDGVFFQWVFCSAVWLFGLMVGAYRGFPQFQPVAMLGGALWCTGATLLIEPGNGNWRAGPVVIGLLPITLVSIIYRKCHGASVGLTRSFNVMEHQ